MLLNSHVPKRSVKVNLDLISEFRCMKDLIGVQCSLSIQNRNGKCTVQEEVYIPP